MKEVQCCVPEINMIFKNNFNKIGSFIDWLVVIYSQSFGFGAHLCAVQSLWLWTLRCSFVFFSVYKSKLYIAEWASETGVFFPPSDSQCIYFSTGNVLPWAVHYAETAVRPEAAAYCPLCTGWTWACAGSWQFLSERATVRHEVFVSISFSIGISEKCLSPFAVPN